MITLEEALTLVGKEVGCSPWHEVTQEKVDRFAEATGDFQFIHVDPERAAREGPFGGTIAHGFLILSMLSTMGFQAIRTLEGTSMGVNYGFGKIRFLAPVTTGSRIRGRFVLARFNKRASGIVETDYEVTVEIENSRRPALTAEWLTLGMPERSRAAPA